MTRTQAREVAMRLVFGLATSEGTALELVENFFDTEYFESLSEEDDSYKVRPDDVQLDYIRRLVLSCAEHEETLKAYIGKYARRWKPERISGTANAVLRCAMSEIIYMEDVPNSAAINEAVQLCKYYDGEETAAFVNGVLGSFVRGEGIEGADAEQGEIELEMAAECEVPEAVEESNTES